MLGLFIALFVVNCAILRRAEAFASKSGVAESAWDGVREVLGSGTLFANAHLLLGPAFAFLETTIVPDYKGFLLMILPPGGFMVVGLLLAAKRVLDQSRAARAELVAAEASNN